MTAPAPSERGWRWYEDPRVGDVIKHRSRRRELPREIIAVHDDHVETMGVAGGQRNTQIARRRLGQYDLRQAGA